MTVHNRLVMVIWHAFGDQVVLRDLFYFIFIFMIRLFPKNITRRVHYIIKIKDLNIVS